MALFLRNDKFLDWDKNGSEVVPVNCNATITFDLERLDIARTAVLSVLCVFAFILLIGGYRLFKASLFLSPFLSVSLILYTIVKNKADLQLPANLGIAVAGGAVAGLFGLLIQVVGVFACGVNLGLALTFGVLLILHAWPPDPSVVTSQWVPIGLFVGLALLFGLLSLHFTKSLVITSSSTIGALILTCTVDHFIHSFVVTSYAMSLAMISVSDTSQRLKTMVCWYGWTIAIAWPVLAACGVLIQSVGTARKFRHDRSRKFTFRTSRNFTEIRASRPRREQRRDPREPRRDPREPRRDPRPGLPRSVSVQQTAPPKAAPHAKFKHLYKIRRLNGDLVSADFLKTLQDRMPGMKDAVERPDGRPQRREDSPDSACALDTGANQTRL